LERESSKSELEGRARKKKSKLVSRAPAGRLESLPRAEGTAMKRQRLRAMTIRISALENKKQEEKRGDRGQKGVKRGDEALEKREGMPRWREELTGAFRRQRVQNSKDEIMLGPGERGGIFSSPKRTKKKKEKSRYGHGGVAGSWF